jgi:hypothetical protein
MSARSIESKGRGQEHPWPPAVSIRRVLAAARRRYHATRLTDRPPLHQPQNVVGLFLLAELIVLAKSGYWPIPGKAQKWIALAPEERARRRRRLARRLADPVSERIAAEVPDLLEYLQRRRA